MLSGNLNSLFTPELIALITATIILPIVAGFALWRYAPLIAQRIDPQVSVPLTINDKGMIGAGLFVIGVLLAIHHTGILINGYIMFSEINVGSLFVLIVSLLLIFRSHLFINLYKQVGKSNA